MGDRVDDGLSESVCALVFIDPGDADVTFSEKDDSMIAVVVQPGCHLGKFRGVFLPLIMNSLITFFVVLIFIGPLVLASVSLL